MLLAVLQIRHFIFGACVYIQRTRGRSLSRGAHVWWISLRQATAVKQARYRRGPTRGSEALYAHAQYNTRCTEFHHRYYTRGEWIGNAIVTSRSIHNPLNAYTNPARYMLVPHSRCALRGFCEVRGVGAAAVCL